MSTYDAGAQRTDEVTPEALVGQEGFGVRDDVIRLVPRPIGRVLDVGCGPGLTGEQLRLAGASEVWGIERNTGLAVAARARLDHVLVTDLEKEPLAGLPAASFDLIIYADVLEHLIDPWTLLRVQRALLRPGGHVVISLPNIRHVRVIADLVLRGNWNYTPEGILSIGHLRFFTTATMRRMIVAAGYRIEGEKSTFASSGRRLSRLTLGRLDDFLAVQRLFVARA